MNIVYTQYFQKSKVFLYPLLGVKKGSKYVPKSTFILWDKFYDKDDYKLILIYEHDNSLEYKIFVDQSIKPLHKYERKFKISDNKDLYLFNMKKCKHDYDCFFDGKFSQMTMEAKRKIKSYFSSAGKISKYIESFLNPEEFHDDYATAFNVSDELIKDVYELCSKPDLSKEMFREKTTEYPFDLRNISISLVKTKTNEQK